MVDKSIEDEERGIKQNLTEDGKLWTEKLLRTFSGHLEVIGYSDVWGEEADQ